LALKTDIHLDAPAPLASAGFRKDEFIGTTFILTDSLINKPVPVDPATSIAFPTELQIPSKLPLPTFTLVGLGVRTVSFLGIKVYSVGFYADLQNPELNVRTFDNFYSISLRSLL
jgi:hypothetical protein